MKADLASNGRSPRAGAPRFPWQAGCGIPILALVGVVLFFATLAPDWKAKARTAEPTARQFLQALAHHQIDAAAALATPGFADPRGRKEMSVISERWMAELGPEAPYSVVSVSTPPLGFGRAANFVFLVRGKEIVAHSMVYLKRQGGSWRVDGAALRQLVH